jgi:formylmethanofuran dehydrogenase subunit A
MQNEYLLTEEDARKQLDGFLAHYDFDPAEIDDSALKGTVESAIKGLVKQIRRGRLELNPDGTAKQTLEDGSILTYAELGAQAKKAMRGDNTDLYGKMYSLVGSLTGVGETGILKIKGIDMSIVENIALVFLRV